MNLKNTADSLQAIQSEISYSYKFLTDHCQCTIERDLSCSTHDHVSFCNDITWDFPDIHRLASWALYFEPAINAITPKVRVLKDHTKGLLMHPIVNNILGGLLYEKDGRVALLQKPAVVEKNDFP